MSLEFQHGLDADMDEVSAGAYELVVDGTTGRLSAPLMGLDVFAVIRTLREHDDYFHDDTLQEDAGFRARVEQLEAWVDEAVAEGAQYYPFGHLRNAYNLPPATAHSLHGDYTSWGTGARTRARRRGHGTEYTTGRFEP